MIYAISDIHGDYKQALKLLQQHGVVDIDGNWVAGQLPHAQGVWLATKESFGFPSNRKIDCPPNLAIFLLALKSAFSACPQDIQRNSA